MERHPIFVFIMNRKTEMVAELLLKLLLVAESLLHCGVMQDFLEVSMGKQDLKNLFDFQSGVFLNLKPKNTKKLVIL